MHIKIYAACKKQVNIMIRLNLNITHVALDVAQEVAQVLKHRVQLLNIVDDGS